MNDVFARASQTPGYAPVVLFPGMGSECVGMSGGWEGRPEWEAILDGAETHSGQPLRRWMRDGPEAELKAQRHSPNATLAHSTAVFHSHRAAGLPLPAAASGYSLGFFASLVAAEVIQLEVAMDLIACTEDLADAAFGAGTMGMAFVIGLAEEDIRKVIRVRPDVVLSNRNGTSNFSLSGPIPALESLVTELLPHCLKAGLLPVQQPLHGPHMAALIPKIKQAMGSVQPKAPVFPLISMWDGRLIGNGPEAWEEAIESIGRAVDWPKLATALKEFPGEWLECGVGSQLAHLTRWLVRDRTLRSLQSPPE